LHGTGEEGLCEEEPGQPEGGRLAMMMPVVKPVEPLVQILDVGAEWL